MEEDKKKRKNKKKKNKQNNATETSVDDVGEHVTSDQNQVSQTDQKSTDEVHEIRDARNDVLLMRDGRDQLRHVVNGPEVFLKMKLKSTLAESEKDRWLEREASLEEKIKQLQKERDAQIQKEANLLEKIKQLEGEKAVYCLKESRLEEEIARLQSENEAQMQKEYLSDLEFSSTEHNTRKEAIGVLNVDNSRLHAQVLQLEQARNSLFEEIQHPSETISGLQSRILNFEANAALSHSSVEGKMQTIENGDVGGLEIEAAHMLVEKLITENAELVEKNELYVELNRRSLQKEMSFDEGTPGTAESAVADNSSDFLDLKVEGDEGQASVLTADLIHKTGAKMLVSGENGQSENDVNIDGRNYRYMRATNAGGYLNSSETMYSDEIVQIPLDENERLLTDLEGGNDTERTEVPISDAPLIGAPFRIISFVARYVSGADLVEKN